ncbi:MAG: hypothetical protein ACIAQF_08270 [Phycisphaerales bacterium JB065]
MGNPADIPVCIVQDNTWKWSFSWSDSDGSIDLSGIDVEIRIATSFDAASASMVLTDGDGLTITAEDGLIQIDKVIDLEPDNYVWCLDIDGSTRIQSDFVVKKKVPAGS